MKSTKGYPVASLVNFNNRKKIILNPDYQRGSVWTRSQKQLFIDSLLRDIDIPKLYFRVPKKPNKDFEVVDGQQRLRTIFEFYNGKFQLDKDADPVDKKVIKGKKYKELPESIRSLLDAVNLDVVIYDSGYTDEDIEETFLRLQNGTPLNAPEKRRAIAGSMRDVVAELSRHEVFKLCSFKNTRFAYEDVVAKILHQVLNGQITDIRPHSIAETYERYSSITDKHAASKKVASGFSFIAKAFKNKKDFPDLKKFSLITLTLVVISLQDRYSVSGLENKVGKAYLKFERIRRENDELDEDEQESALVAYTNAARSDSIQDMQYRFNMIFEDILKNIKTLKPKDSKRAFSAEQRAAIFWKDDGKCKKCGKKLDFDNFEADHIHPHSKGGWTRLDNGQLLCSACNKSKSAKI